MEREWTKHQLKAITEHNKTLLISAAAGSGKTAVLVERILQKILTRLARNVTSKMEIHLMSKLGIILPQTVWI